jgi:hypothetical protein
VVAAADAVVSVVAVVAEAAAAGDPPGLRAN